MSGHPVERVAADVVHSLVARGLTVAVAESLTGGLVASALIEVPGASRTVRGAIVAYATPLKHDLLGVDAALLGEHGPIHPDVALMMAAGVRERCGADIGIATTGVAGPDSQDGHLPGEVYVAAVMAGRTEVRGLQIEGDRGRVRSLSVVAALELVIETVGLSNGQTPEHPPG
jgi:nicotinamide-nucleotide amidase